MPIESIAESPATPSTQPVPRSIAVPARAGDRALAWWEWGDASASHTVICVHGLTRQGRDFDVLARALVASAPGPLRVVCPDVAGRGRSGRLDDAAGYAIPTYVADALIVISHLRSVAPIDTLDWFGTSMGGLIGLAIAGTPALRQAVPIRRLVLNDVGPAIERSALERIGRGVGLQPRFASVHEACEALWRVSSGFGPHTPQAWRALTEPMLRDSGNGGYLLHYDPAIGDAFRGLTPDTAQTGEAALWALYDQVAAETLVVRGADSDLLSAATAEAMTARGPRASLVTLEGVGHAPTFVSPDQVALALDFLLRSTAPRG